jgi:hypothetical protein
VTIGELKSLLSLVPDETEMTVLGSVMDFDTSDCTMAVLCWEKYNGKRSLVLSGIDSPQLEKLERDSHYEYIGVAGSDE